MVAAGKSPPRARVYFDTERDSGRRKRSGSEACQTESRSVCLLTMWNVVKIRLCGDAGGAKRFAALHGRIGNAFNQSFLRVRTLANIDSKRDSSR